eukprot:3699353-Amphidinium_carterae.2
MLSQLGLPRTKDLHHTEQGWTDREAPSTENSVPVDSPCCEACFQSSLPIPSTGMLKRIHIMHERTSKSVARSKSMKEEGTLARQRVPYWSLEPAGWGVPSTENKAPVDSPCCESCFQKFTLPLSISESAPNANTLHTRPGISLNPKKQ